MYMCSWPPSPTLSTTHFATFRPPIVEVVNVNEERGVGEESQHGGGDEAAGDVGPGLAHKVDNHLSHIRIGNCNHIRLDTTIIIIIYKWHDQLSCRHISLEIITNRLVVVRKAFLNQVNKEKFNLLSVSLSFNINYCGVHDQEFNDVFGPLAKKN